ncbi:MAG: flavin-containing monooxygenase [Candidatus Dormibacteria bacterium]
MSATHVRVAIAGAGFSGVGLAIQMKRHGFHDFVILERADDLGGTWRDNSYPGCCCDIPSHVYSYSFQLEPGWTRGFASQPEILGYLRRAADANGIGPHLRVQHEVLEARWDRVRRLWHVETSQGTYTADVFVAAAGPLSDPSIPHLPGLDTFRGTIFHSARWNHDHDLRGRRVAVVGTGASAIQFVPRIQPQVAQLTLFQRTPPWVMPRLDHEITPAEHWLLRHVPLAPALTRAALWGALELRIVGFRNPRLMRGAEKLARWHMRRQVPDEALRRKLTPDYTLGCKRILLSDDYYPALTQANVEVVTAGVGEVRPSGIVDGEGIEHPADTIIFGTGFHVTDAPVASRIRGADGRTLAEVWDPSMRAYLGTTVSGFPNMFFMLGPNTGLGHNSMVHMIESQVAYIVDALRAMEERGIGVLEVRPEAVEAYNRWLDDRLRGTVWTAGHCRSWYLDSMGRNSTLWPGSTVAFRRRTRRFRPRPYRLLRAAQGRPSQESSGPRR